MTPKMRRRELMLTLLAIAGARALSGVAATATAGVTIPRYCMYYLWITRSWWLGKLGDDYKARVVDLDPATWPLPAVLATDTEYPTSLYPGNKLIDVCNDLWYAINNPGVIEWDMRVAQSVGFNGFLVNWNRHTEYDRYLEQCFQAAAKLNARTGATPFTLILDLKTASKPSIDSLIASTTYYLDRYGSHPAQAKPFSTKPHIIFSGAYQYSEAEKRRWCDTFRPRAFLLSGANWSSWTSADTQMWDGAAPYWSGQDPKLDPQSVSHLQKFSALLHGAGKRFVCPLNPGYNDILLRNGRLVPRRNGDHLRELFAGNKTTNPDAWGFISWNEIAEATHIVPLGRYGAQYTNLVKQLFASS
jgi:hypothetical protein